MAYSRQFWGARPPRKIVIDTPKHTLYIHHSGSPDGYGIDTVAEQIGVMRGIQRFHMDVRGWNDIGYSFVLFQPRGRGKTRVPRLYVGRGPIAMTASQVPNTGGISVCVIVDDEPIHPLTRERLEGITRSLARRRGISRVLGHRDVQATDCPGDELARLVPHLSRIAASVRADR